jgi:ankyrin repeat protein
MKTSFISGILVLFMLGVMPSVVFTQKPKAGNSSSTKKPDPFFTFSEGSVSEAKKLINKGFDVNKRDRENSGWTPIFYAVAGGNEEMVSLLIERGANVNGIDADRFSPLYYALVAKKLKIAKKLIGGGGDVNFRYTSNANLLTIAIANGSQEMMDVLIAAGATLEPLPQEKTLLHFAAQLGNIEIAKKLIEKGLNVNDQENRTQQTPLLCATNFNKIEMIKFLISKGANPNIGDNSNRTPLILASMKNYCELLEVLVSYKANVNAKTTSGQTALLFAKQSCAIEILVKSGAKVNVQNEYGDTPLISAVISAVRRQSVDSINSVEILLKAGADVTIKNFDGKDALFYAKKSKNKQIIALLENAIKARQKQSK